MIKVALPKRAPKSVIKTATECFKHLPKAETVIVRSMTTGQQFAFTRDQPIR